MAPTRSRTATRTLRVQAQPIAAPAVDASPLINSAINSIRLLAVDAVNKSKSGHPGMPMGCAPMGFVLWNDVMRYNPKNPKWFNRDRFVLSAGHGSMLLYAMLHLTGYDSVSMDDIKQLRQWGSHTPGHPENFVTKGVEVTTGPLGQGFCNAVGLAVAEAHLAARFNRPDVKPIVDHYTFCIMGDGCMMEGMQNEAASLAGHWGLGKLIALYDDNNISIDGSTHVAFTEDVGKRYEALGWHVVNVPRGNTDIEGLRKAIAQAKSVTDKPTMIKVTTLIGYGSPNKADTEFAHGTALGEEEAEATRRNLGWTEGPFTVPAEVYTLLRKAVGRGAEHEAGWTEACKAYAAKHPEEWSEFSKLTSSELPAGWESCLPTFEPDEKGMATRKHSQAMLNALADVLPGLIGGSADLAPSNLTLLKKSGDFQKDSYAERNLRFGVREHAMGAICNGISHHSSGLIPYCATFLIFTDYMRASMRLAALSGAGVIYVMTHDSIGLGEDGPTHQPIEHLASFRAMPGIVMLRPAGGNETAGAYKIAVESRRRPSVLALSRQSMPTLPNTSIEGPDVILMGTGSELHLAHEAALLLEREGKHVRVVSFPSWELFELESEEYRDQILPPSVQARVAVEAGSSFGWREWIGACGFHVGIDRFGASAPGPVIYEKHNITAQGVVDAAHKSLAKVQKLGGSKVGQ
ncbi:MAG: hypothetical protein WDW36_001057 [Sanguina aurantia]